MSWIKSRQIVAIVAGLSGFVVVFSYFLDLPALTQASNQLQNWTVVIIGFAMGYGALNLIIKNTRTVIDKKEGWPYSIILLVSLFAMLISGSIQPFFSHPVSIWLFNNLQVRTSTTLFALLAPFVASAAYRSFRARNKESALMLLTAFFIMMGNTPFLAGVWDGFPVLGNWINSVPAMAGQRGIRIGAYIGGIAIGIRVLIGLERTYMGRED